jgi:hypothetical protein
MVIEFLEPGDKVLYSYPGRIEGRFGYLLLTKKTLMLIREEGFLTKTHMVVLNLPYNRISEYSTKKNFNLEIVDSSSGRTVFVSDVMASHIVDALRRLISERKLTIPVL